MSVQVLHRSLADIMHILHVIPSLDPATGGPVEVVRALLTHGPADDVQEVATLDDPGARFLAEYSAPVHALGPRRTGYGRTPRLAHWLRTNAIRFDGVILHGLWQYTGYAVWRAMRGRVPYFVFPHGMMDPWFKRAYPLKHVKKWLYWAPVEYKVLRDASRVLFTCKAEAELAEQSFWLHQWDGTVVQFGTIPPADNAEVQCAAFFAACPSMRKRKFLLFLGRIDRKKGCDLLVDSFTRLASHDPDLDLVIAGPDPANWRLELERPAVDAGIESRIHWPGMLRGDAKWGAFRAAEAFVLPSHQENFGIAVAEALACATPVLLSKSVNIAAEIVADGAGLMEDDTANGVDRLLTRWMELSRDEQEAMADRAQQCFHRRYDMRDNAKIILRLFRQTST